RRLTMKRLLATLTFALALPLLALSQEPSPSSQQSGKQANRPQRRATDKNSKAEQEIIKLDEAWNNALLRRDAAAYNRILAEDYIRTSSRGQLADKAQEIKDLMSGDGAVESVVTDRQVHFVEDDVAVLTARYREKTKDGEQQGRYTVVYAKRNGRWQAVAFHSSPITP
ncbi:MAG TPA: nuclear transport factor 2 family protein, partial [Blastocatellia bacterium]|nr:nuclear transport factor 2 family protein [Blastocatellia bacterium]